MLCGLVTTSGVSTTDRLLALAFKVDHARAEKSFVLVDCLGWVEVSDDLLNERDCLGVRKLLLDLHSGQNQDLP